MGKILQLPTKIVSKIAAGQVIERPSSVVKELVENSIDAKAKNIRIELKKSGKQKIRVIDDGEGMDKDDISRCFEPHSTSKLLKIADLNCIKSQGFRGEALSSVVSVAEIEIKSRILEDEFGYLVSVVSGKSSKVLPVGTPVGTTVTVTNLFSTIPARKKFLKSDQTELNHIMDVVLEKAVAFPEIGFKLFSNDDLILNFLKNQTLPVRASNVLGESMFSKLLEFSEDVPHIFVSGYISLPQYSRRTSKKQFVFVNNRNVKDKKLLEAIRRGYGSLLNSQFYPVVILNIKLPAEMVDVNVHPRKEEIGFVNESEILRVVETAVKNVLQKNDLTNVRDGFSSLENLYVSKDLGKPGVLKDSGFDKVFQLHNLYLVLQNQNGMLIVDQHAAHERIIYEELLVEYESEYKKSSVEMKRGVVLNLSADELGVVRQNQATFQKLGFEMEDFGKGAIKITKIPKILANRNIESLFLQILDDLFEERSASGVDEKTKQVLSYVACRSAIKAGDVLTKEQIAALLVKLSKTNVEYVCPHGRPLKVEIPLKEIDRMFERK